MSLFRVAGDHEGRPDGVRPGHLPAAQHVPPGRAARGRRGRRDAPAARAAHVQVRVKGTPPSTLDGVERLGGRPHALGHALMPPGLPILSFAGAPLLQASGFTARVSCRCRRDAPDSSEPPATPAPSAFEVDDEFNLPISVAITILLLYMFVGASIYYIWENWGFFESFYFVFISMSTIGFGDFVPKVSGGDFTQGHKRSGV